MAVRTSIGFGLWSAAGTWDTGVPVDDDSAVIANGHVVEFDVDTSGFASGIAGITVTGTLSLTRSAGTYYLKIKAAATIAGAGTFDCGTLASPIPFTAKHTITGGAAWYIQGSGGLTMTVYAAEPANPTILLSGDEAIGQTELSVDTDVTGDIWAVGDTVRIDDINKTAESEARVIAGGGIAAGAITVTLGLTAAKSTGAFVHLITRNVRFIGVGAAGFVCQNFASGKLTVAGGEWTTASYRVFSACTAMTISGGTFSGNSWGVASSTGAFISGGIFSGNSQAINGCANVSVSGGTFSGNTYGIGTCTNVSVSGGTFSGNTYGLSTITGMSISGGTFSKCSAGVTLCVGASISGGTFSGNTYGLNGTGMSISGGTVSENTNGLNACVGTSISGGTFSGNTYGMNATSAVIKSATFSTNTQDIYRSVITAYNTAFDSAMENSGYTDLSKEIYSESFDHDQVAGAFKAWTKGGVTTKQAVVFPVGYTYSMQTVLADASNEGFWQKEVLVSPAASVTIGMNLRKDDTTAYLPRIIIFDKGGTDPFAGGAGEHTFTMTDSVDTWESDTHTYTNETAADVTLIIRCQGKDAGLNMFSLVDVEFINVDLTTVLANLAIVDGVVDAIKLKTDNLPADPADESLLEAAINAITDFDAVVAAGYTGLELFRVLAAVLAGKVSGGGTNTIIFRDVGDTKNVVTATVDAAGNRTVVVLDATP